MEPVISPRWMTRRFLIQIGGRTREMSSDSVRRQSLWFQKVRCEVPYPADRFQSRDSRADPNPARFPPPSADYTVARPPITLR